jgi:hypothetical protein
MSKKNNDMKENILRGGEMSNMNRLFFALGLLTGAAVTWILALGLQTLK